MLALFCVWYGISRKLENRSFKAVSMVPFDFPHADFTHRCHILISLISDKSGFSFGKKDTRTFPGPAGPRNDLD